MMILSNEAHKQLNKLYGNRKFFLTNNTFCKSFIFYSNNLLKSIHNVANLNCRYVLSRGVFIATFNNCCIIYFRVSNDKKVVAIESFGFIGLPMLYRKCAYERKEANTQLKKRPTHSLSSRNPSDYIKIPKGNGGMIGNEQVFIVQRKDTIRNQAQKPLFNYLYHGKIISKYDFLSATPFSDYNGIISAYADAANGKRYWIYPNGRLKLKESITNRISRIITEVLNNFLKKNILLVS